MNSRANVITTALFGLILAAPILLAVSGIELTKPLEENRIREKFPEIADCDFVEFDACHRKIDEWFNDNYGLRDLLIKLKTQLDYSVFSTSDKLHIGADNWLFYRSVMDREKVANERLTQAQFETVLHNLEKLDRYLNRRNIQLVVLPLPLKDAIYPEKLPRSSPDLPRNSRYQQLRTWLAQNDSIITVDAYDFFIDLKRERPVFHKTDFHWNDPAGFLFAEILVNKLWTFQSGASDPLWDQELSITYQPSSGGQAMALPLLVAPSEAGLFLDTNRQPGKGSYNLADVAPPWTYTYDGAGEERGRLGTTVILGDSFFDALYRSGIDTFFSSVYKANTSAVSFEEVLENLPEGTRYFIYEAVEVNFFWYVMSGLEFLDEE